MQSPSDAPFLSEHNGGLTVSAVAALIAAATFLGLPLGLCESSSVVVPLLLHDLLDL